MLAVSSPRKITVTGKFAAGFICFRKIFVVENPGPGQEYIKKDEIIVDNNISVVIQKRVGMSLGRSL